jgi:hypothetical protein
MTGPNVTDGERAYAECILAGIHFWHDTTDGGCYASHNHCAGYCALYPGMKHTTVSWTWEEQGGPVHRDVLARAVEHYRALLWAQ